MFAALLGRLGRMHRNSALRHRRFRLLWLDSLLSSTARWADVVVIGWLTLELTESAFMVGVVAAAKMGGYLAAPFMGVIADRMDRQKLLLASAGVNLGVSLLLLALFASGAIALWHVVALALASSFTWALDQPTRNAFVPDLVGSEDLTNAIALNAVAVEITVVVGPALGGLLIPAFGVGGAYALIAGLYVLDVAVLRLLKDERHRREHVHASPAKSLLEGLGYVRANRLVLVLLVMAGLLNLLAAPYRYAFLPLFARYVLDTGAAGYGILTATAGVGALIAGLWVVSLGDFERKGALLAWSALGWPLSLLLLSVSTWYAAALVLVFLAGLLQAIVWTVIATLILGHTLPAMRGRVMGLRAGVVASLPLGNFMAGALAEQMGAPWAQALYAGAALLLMLAILARVPRLRGLP